MRGAAARSGEIQKKRAGASLGRAPLLKDEVPALLILWRKPVPNEGC